MSIVVKNLNFVYSKGTPYEKKALDNVSFEIGCGECVGIIGATGSGKSTLVQHLNGLIKLQNGEIGVLEIHLAEKKPDYRKLRKSIGMLFQYPEYQLFANTVIEDVMFGAKNFGFSDEEAEHSAKKSIFLVGLDESILEKSPLEISGGQKRRVAIAGVLSYNPQILILDEPTAGLDPNGKKEILDLVTEFRKDKSKIVIMVSHNMDEIAEYTDRVLVMNNSKLLFDTTPREFFYNNNSTSLHLGEPHAVSVAKKLAKANIDIGKVVSEKELLEAVCQRFGGNNG